MPAKQKPTASSKSKPSKEQVGSKRRRLGRRDTEEAADRALQSHFPNWPAELLSLKEVDGKNMREAVIEQKRAQRESGGYLGPKYWESLAQKYGDSPQQLVPEDNTLSVDEGLTRALVAARSTHTTAKSADALLHYLSTTPTMNSREATGLANHVHNLRPETNEVALKVCDGDHARL